MKKRANVLELSKRIIKELKPFSSKIQVAGSIRRKQKNPRDIDIVLIPKDKLKIKKFLETKGKFLQGGEQRVRFRIQGVKVELYYTTPEEWGATLLAYSSRKGAGIGLRIIARLKGFKLSQHGLFKGNKLIASRTEKDIYSALGRPYKEPEKR